MKIALDVSAVKNKSTGTGKYIACLREQLQPFNHQILTFPDVNLNSQANIFSRNYYKTFKLGKSILKHNVDFGIFPNYFIPISFNKPSAIVIHDLSFLTFPQFYSKSFVSYYRILLNNTLKKNPLILTISEHSKEQIVKHLNIKKEKIFLLQGYHNPQNSPSDIFRENNNYKYFLTVGHIEPRKNLLFLVDNFLKWKQKNNFQYKLKITGEVWIKSKEVKILLEKYKNNPNIIFTGYVGEHELRKLYKNASAFVHTSFEEGFGFPVLEAMHYNLPVLCSDNNAAKEISTPYSATINPYSSKSLIDGFDILQEKIMRQGEKYHIKYSPKLMNEQLQIILEHLKEKTNGKVSISFSKTVNVKEAIEKTLLYSGLFSSGIDKNSIHKLLFDIKIKKEDLERHLTDLYSEQKITIVNNKIYLNFDANKFYKGTTAKLNEKKIKRSLFILNNIPFISGIFLSGGSANYGIENHNDIDLFIITKPNALFLVYLLIHVFSKLFNVRKELCANYLVDINNLEINQRDYYTAHQIVSLVPLKNKNELNHFILQNKWILNFFPNFKINFSKKQKTSKIYFILKPINKAIKYFYRILYTKQLRTKPDSIKLNENCIKLHTNDHRTKILKIFNEEWERYYSEKKTFTYRKITRLSSRFII